MREVLFEDFTFKLTLSCLAKPKQNPPKDDHNLGCDFRHAACQRHVRYCNGVNRQWRPVRTGTSWQGFVVPMHDTDQNPGLRCSVGCNV